MRVVGLCGRSGSGKSLFSRLASEMGAFVIDCDAVYRELVSYRSDCLSEIESAFGSDVVENDSLNRKKLAPIVFSNPEKLDTLNKITHRHILAEVGKRLTESDCRLVILDAPTLFESGADAMCDTVVSVVADDETCISRITVRDAIDRDSALVRLNNQKSLDFLIENSDIVIYNDPDLADFETASREVIAELLEAES